MKHEPSVFEELQRFLDPPLQEVPRRLLLIIFGNCRCRFGEVSESVQRSLKDQHHCISQIYSSQYVLSRICTLGIFWSIIPYDASFS